MTGAREVAYLQPSQQIPNQQVQRHARPWQMPAAQQQPPAEGMFKQGGTAAVQVDAFPESYRTSRGLQWGQPGSAAHAIHPSQTAFGGAWQGSQPQQPPPQARQLQHVPPQPNWVSPLIPSPSLLPPINLDCTLTASTAWMLAACCGFQIVSGAGMPIQRVLCRVSWCHQRQLTWLAALPWGRSRRLRRLQPCSRSQAQLQPSFTSGRQLPSHSSSQRTRWKP